MSVAFWTGVEEKGRMAGRNAVGGAGRAANCIAGLARGWRRVCRIAGAARYRRIVPAIVCDMVVGEIASVTCRQSRVDYGHRAKKLKPSAED